MINNFRSYKNEAIFEDLSDINIVIGSNNVGKSNFLKALVWYRDMHHETDSYTDIRHSDNRQNSLVLVIDFGLSKPEREQILNLSGKNAEAIQTIMNFSSASKLRHWIKMNSYGLEEETLFLMSYSGDWLPVFGLKAKGSTCESWAMQEDESYRVLTEESTIPEIPAPHGSTSGIPKRAFTWNIMNSIVNIIQNFLDICLNTWHFTSASRRFNFQTEVNQEYVISETCENVIRVLHTILTEDPDRYVEIIREIRKIIPDFDKITIPLSGNRVTGRVKELGNVVVEFSDISSGSHQVLMLISTIMTVAKNSLIMIEEPEQSLHAHAQRALFNLIKILSNTEMKQFVITTHSTVFTKISNRVHTYLVQKEEGSTVIKNLKEFPSLILVKHSLGHENTDLFFYNAIIIVEGDIEEKAIPLFAESMGIDIIEIGIRVIDIGGSGNTTRIKELMEFLRDTDIPTYFVMDKHSTSKESLQELVIRKIVDENNILWIEKGFEDSFSDYDLACSLEEIAKDNQISFEIEEGEISSRRNEKPIFKGLKRLFYERTNSELRKTEYGLKLVDRMLSTHPEFVRSTDYGRFIERIANYLDDKNITKV